MYESNQESENWMMAELELWKTAISDLIGPIIEHEFGWVFFRPIFGRMTLKIFPSTFGAITQ